MSLHEQYSDYLDPQKVAAWTPDELRKKLRSLALLASTATFEGDQQALARLQDLATSSGPRPTDDADNEFRRGVFETLAAVAYHGLTELHARELIAAVPVQSLPHRLLKVIERAPECSTAQLQDQLGDDADPDALESAQGVLVDHVLVDKSQGEADSTWVITPRGERMLDTIGRA